MLMRNNLLFPALNDTRKRIHYLALAKHQPGTVSLRRKIILLLITSIFSTCSLFAQTWTGTFSTSWENGLNWSTLIVPGSSATVTIPGTTTTGRMPVISSSTTIGALTINAGGSVTQTGGTLTINNSLSVSGTYNQSGGTISIGDYISGAGTFNQTANTAVLKVAGNWAPGSGNVFNSTAGTVQFSSSKANRADFSLGSFQFFNIVVDAGADPAFDRVNGSEIKIGGDFTNNNSSLSNFSRSTFTFNGSGTQNIFSASSGTSPIFGNLVIDKVSGSVILLSNANVAANTTLNNGTFDLQTFTSNNIGGSGTITLGAGTTLRVAGASGGQTGSNMPINFTAATISPSSTIEYYGSNSITQTIFAGVTYGNLVISNGSGTGSSNKITTANLTVDGQLTVNSGAVLTPLALTTVGGTGTLTGTGTVKVTRTLATADFLSQYPISNKVLANLTVDYDASAAQIVNALDYGNLAFSGTRGASTITLPANGTVGISGTFTPSATFTSGSYIRTGSTIVFNGSAPQTVPAFSFNNITINNVAGVTLSGNITVGGILAFTSGKITTGTFSVIIPAGASITGATQATGWVYGNLQKYFSTVTGVFDIGCANYYSPISVTFSSLTTAGSLVASAFNTAHPNIGTSTIPALNINRYWRLSVPGTGAVVFPSLSVIFNWNIADNYASINAPSLLVAKYTSLSWTYPVLSGTPTTTSIRVTGVTTLGDFAVGQVCTVTSGFSYSASSFCTSGTTAAATLSPGATAGIFSASPAGLSINASNGNINLAASAAGTYTVTNAVGGPCFSTSTTTVTINKAAVAGISYSGTPYCTGSATTATVSFSGSTGGAFTAGTGLVINSTTGTVDIANSTPGSYTVTYTIAAAGACSQFVVTTPISIQQAGVWTGASNTSWTNSANWSCNLVPTSTVNVIIPTGLTRYPVIAANSTATVKNLSVASGASITILGTIQVAGSITAAAGSMTADSGTIEMNGSTAQIIPAGIFSNELANLVVNNNAGVTLGGTINLNDILSIKNGTLNTGGFLTLKSTINGTARVGGITSAAANPIVGEVTVERYVPGRRKYRLITSPVTTSSATLLTPGQESKSIWGNWQNGGLPTAGVGTLITGGSTADGFDQGTATASMYTYDDSTRKYVPFSSANGKNTKLTPLKAGVGYYMFVYGDRTNSLTATTPSPTTLRQTGTLLTGQQVYNPGSSIPISGVDGRYSLIGNPYACTIDWKTVTKTNVSKTIYGWDANLSSTGGYVSVTATLLGITIAPLSALTAVNRYIQPGQAFFVQTNGPNPQVVISESDKIDDKVNINSNVFRTTEVNQTPLMAVNLLYNVGTTQVLNDGAVVVFDSSFANTVDSEDGLKFVGSTEGLAMVVDTNLVSINARKFPAGNDTIKLNITKLTRPTYTLQIFANKLDASRGQAYLYDAYLSTQKLLSFTDTNNISFSINPGVPASVSATRFSIVFKSNTVLPVKFISVSALRKEKQVEVKWEIATEQNISIYKVQSSTDGVHFTTIANLNPAGNNNNYQAYSFVDTYVPEGTRYYQVQAVTLDGSFIYSKVVVVRAAVEAAVVKVFPNPIKGRKINLQLSGLAKGSFTIQLFNTHGQKVFGEQFEYNGTGLTYEIPVGNKIAAGMYYLRLINEQQVYNESIIIQ
jgi:hypothetical protein